MTKRNREAAEALAKRLKAMFGALKARPVPDRLRSVVDQMDDEKAPPAPRKNRA